MRIIDKVLGVKLVNKIGEFQIGAYKIERNNEILEYYLVYKNNICYSKNVRINSACYTSDLFGCGRCDCNEQLNDALCYFEKENNGLLIYCLSEEGRGVGAVNKLKTLKLMTEEELTTKQAFEKCNFPVDNRNYDACSLILKDLGLENINLLTNNPDKIKQLEENGIKVIKRIELVSKNNKIQKYLLSKKYDFGHLI